MRTPEPVRPSQEQTPEYKRTLFDRHGPEAAMFIRVAQYLPVIFIASFIMWGALASIILHIDGPKAVVFVAVMTILTTFAAWWLGLKVGHLGGDAFRAFIQPSGKSTPYEEQYSYQDALEMKGDVAGALESYEAVIAEQPTLVKPRVKAAELYIAKGKNPRRAAELFKEIQRIPGVTQRDEVYASTRLADLYEGALGEPRRALVELRRIAERFPSAPQAMHAREAISRIKATLPRED